MTDTAPLTASMPQFTQLGNNSHLYLEALNPGTGDPVSGVVVASVDIYADVVDESGGGGALTIGPFMLVPGPGA